MISGRRWIGVASFFQEWVCMDGYMESDTNCITIGTGTRTAHVCDRMIGPLNGIAFANLVLLVSRHIHFLWSKMYKISPQAATVTVQNPAPNP